MLNDLMLKSYLPLEWYPNAQVGDVIKLTDRDIELAHTMVDPFELVGYDDLYLVVEYIIDDGILGSLCQEVDLEIKWGSIDPGDYKVVGFR